MAITTYAAITVDSSELAMKVYEMSRPHGIKEITHVRHRLSLGSEIFTTGQISYRTMSEICRVLEDFKKVMEEYKVSAYHAFATDAFRDASNKLVVLDQIKLQANIKVRILSNSEERFLCYKAISMNEKAFEHMINEGALIVDMSAGSVQLSLFSEGALSFTQKLKLGASRISELLHTLEPEMFSYHELISEYIDKDLTTFFQLYLQDKEIHHTIVMGTKIPEITYRVMEWDKDFTGVMSRSKFTNMKLSPLLKSEQSEVVIPAILLFKKIVSLTECDDIYLSSTDLCDSMAAEYAEKKNIRKPKHDFTEDIIATAKILRGATGWTWPM